MALKMMLQSWLVLSLVLVLNSFSIPTCHCQTNIETSYPNETSSPGPATQPLEPPPQSPPPQGQAPGQVVPSRSSSSNGKIAKAVAVTAASTLVACVLVFILVQRCLRVRRRRKEMVNNTGSGGDRRVVPQGNVFERIDGNVRGLIVDEDGLDVVYWRKLEGKNTNNKDLLHKEVLHSPKNEEGIEDDHQVKKKSKSIQEVPLLRGKSSSSHMNISPEEDQPCRFATIPPPSSASSASPLPPRAPVSGGVAIKGVQEPDSPSQPCTPPPPISPSTPPVAPPIPARKSPAPPPPPMKIGGSIEMPVTSLSKQGNSSGKGMPETSNGQVKLEPQHWDKVNANADHSMVWDKVDSVDQDLMEALFGYVATNRRSPKGKNHSTYPSRDTSAPSTKIFLLDQRKSQNIAIILKSLAVSQGEILDSLRDGKGLNADTLEKLGRVSPTEEEQSLILQHQGDPARLAAAESFIYYILKAVPSAFKRLDAMLFRLNYDYEILEITESLQIIELGCKELKSHGIFAKLLEAVLKAGNRMNAGTARGNAQAFNLDSLRKLSDVKSSNGKSTLLHFVVEEVVRSEGKLVVLNRNRSLSRSSSSRSNNISGNSEKNAASNGEREREYTMLGLPIVGGMSSELSNVKKAAHLGYKSVAGSISALSTRLVEIQQLVSQCGNGEGDYFAKEMNHFLRNADQELNLVRDKEASIMQLVNRTTQYYQGVASKDNAAQSLQLFVVVKDFMGMVDQACVEIARDMQKRKTPK